MNEPSLTDIKAFHRDLLTVSAAGVPLAGSPLGDRATRAATGWIGLSSVDAEVHSLRESLLTIEQRLAAASLEGRPLADALKSHTQASPHYVAALQVWLTSGHDPAAFDDWATAAQRACQKKWNLRIACVQPLVWLVVSYIGLTFISLGIAPQFLALSRQLHVAPGFALSTLLSIRAGFPIWGVVVPLLILTSVCALYLFHLPTRWFTRSKRMPVDRMPVDRKTSPSQHATNFTTWGFDDQHRPTQPGAAWVLLGGVLVLGIALCVFGPLIELLYSVALPLGLCLPLGFLTASGG
ncbi:MAG: hypothetical protein IT422_01390 [Pirellulaceae bacterium]|jgi:hypothetical protein|nr:hypothetical protein [Pirellulaceae bacterium]